jgi:polyisoprenoid-binding protein YceI
MNVFPETQASEMVTRQLWKIDPIHSSVGFSARHLMVANVRGVFEHVAGTVLCDPLRPETAEVNVTVAAASVQTREPQRDQHLRSADFLDAEKYPQITFRSTGLHRRGSGLELSGELTLRGVTKPFVFTVTEISAEHRDLQGARRFGASARGSLKRSEFGITFNKLLEAGGVAISDEITLNIDVSLVQATS